MPDDEDRSAVEQARREKLARLRAAGIDAFPVGFRRTHTLAEVRRLWDHQLGSGEESGDVVRVAGRVVLKRDMGRLAFWTLRHDGSELQILLTVDALGPEQYRGGDSTWTSATGSGSRAGHQDQEGRAVGQGDRGLPARQVPAAPARQVEGPDRRRGPLPPARARPDRQPGGHAGHAGALPGRPVPARVDARPRLPRGRDADPQPGPRRRPGPAVRHPPQRPRHRPVPPGGQRAVPEAAAGRRGGPGVRAGADVPQRGHRPTQHRVHHAGVQLGVPGLPGHDGAGPRVIQEAADAAVGGRRLTYRGREIDLDGDWARSPCSTPSARPSASPTWPTTGRWTGSASCATSTRWPPSPAGAPASWSSSCTRSTPSGSSPHLRHRPPGRGLAPGPPAPRRPVRDRAVRADHRRRGTPTASRS